MSIGVLGGGAFGTALAIALGAKGSVQLYMRDARAAANTIGTGQNTHRLPGCDLPKTVSVSAEIRDLAAVDTILLAVPMQTLGPVLAQHSASLSKTRLVACCKGLSLESGEGPIELMADALPNAPCAVLTGPSFAVDIARNQPTALTLACEDPAVGQELQSQLSTPTLRLYTTTDTTGAQLGGALKNVMAIAAGVTIGAGLGESARAAVITRGFAELQRFAISEGARPETLGGLSGLGDLVLTATSEKSRNYRFGRSLGANDTWPGDETVEGAATAQAAARLATARGIDMPITRAVAALVAGHTTVADVIVQLMARPLKDE